MVNWKPIEPNHPFLRDYEREEEKPWPGTYLHRLYQPTNGNWPIYDLQVRRHNSGVSISSAVKRNKSSWWETCDGFEPLPFELAVELVNMILKGAEQ